MDALKEDLEVRQRPEEGYRRWYFNDFFDVILWYTNKGGEIIGFQVCYEKNTTEEKAYTYEFSTQSHHFVSSLNQPISLGNLGSALLQGDAGKIPLAVIERLKEESGELSPDELSLIQNQMQKFNDK